MKNSYLLGATAFGLILGVSCGAQAQTDQNNQTNRPPAMQHPMGAQPQTGGQMGNQMGTMPGASERGAAEQKGDNGAMAPRNGAFNSLQKSDSGPVTAADKRFVTKAIQGNLAEVALGKLAESHASSDKVKNFGRMLEKDHGEANEKADRLARQIGMTPPDETSAQNRRVYNRLAKLQGAQFDKQFVSHMVADHREDIRDYQRESRTRNAQIGEFAKQSLPVLHKHLDTAVELSRMRTSNQ